MVGQSLLNKKTEMAKTTYVIRISAKKICMWIRKKDELQASFAYTALKFPKRK